MTDEARSCRVQVLVDGHTVADCECLNCDVEVERGGVKVSVEPGGPYGDVREWRPRDILRVRACAAGRVELSAPGGGRDERA